MIKRSTKPKAIWREAFPEQAKALRPEHSAAGGVKARSQSKAIRDAVYKGINNLYACAHPYCDACHLIPGGKKQLHFRDDTHHKKSREGLLLFDVRYFLSVCRWSHRWIHDNPADAKRLGLLEANP